MELLTRNLVIFPSKETAEAAITMSKDLANRYETSIVLNNSDTLPHLTVHQFAFPHRNLMHIEDTVAAIARDTKPFDVQLETIGRFGDGGIWWDAEIADNELWKLHAKVVRGLASLQEKARLPHLEGIMSGDILVSEPEKEAYKVYGNPWANPNTPASPYRPHITISKLNDTGDINTALGALKPQPHRFSVSSLHLALLGQNGTCAGSLREFSFIK